MNFLTHTDIPVASSAEFERGWVNYSNIIIDWLDTIKGAFDFRSTWSLWEVRDFNEVPFPNATYLIYETGWGTPENIKLKPNSTWLDLWKAADTLIIESGDRHHIFIEAFNPQDNGLVRLVTGS